MIDPKKPILILELPLYFKTFYLFMQLCDLLQWYWVRLREFVFLNSAESKLTRHKKYTTKQKIVIKAEIQKCYRNRQTPQALQFLIQIIQFLVSLIQIM